MCVAGDLANQQHPRRARAQPAGPRHRPGRTHPGTFQ